MPTFSGTPFPTLALGRESTLAIKPDGTLASWGVGDMVPAPQLSGLVMVDSSSNDWGLALHSDGTVSLVGVAPGDGLGWDLPGWAAGLTNAVHVNCSLNHAVAVLADGTVTCAGFNGQGQCDPPVGLNNAYMAVAGENFTMALRSDGTLIGWGDLPAATPALTGVSLIETYRSTIVALLDDGTVAAWGANSSGQADVPAGLSGVVSASTGASNSLVSKSDGTVENWGSSGYSPPAGLSNVVQVAGGWNAAGAIKADGTVVMWGQYAGSEATVPAGFEAMLPGDQPDPPTIEATVPFSAEILAFVGPVGSLEASVSFGAEIRAFQDWVSAIPAFSVQRVYLMTITAGDSGLDDLVVPLSSWQATSQAGARSSYLQGVVPAAVDLIDGIAQRQSGKLVIHTGYRFSDGSVRTEELLKSNFDTFRFDRGPRSFSVTVSGYLSDIQLSTGTRTVTGIRSISMTNGRRRVRCDIDFFLKPGMTVIAEDQTFVAGFINYYVSEVDQFCEIGER
ncbi:MAG: hypothetical protein CMI02_04935 [Oceanospirillaceae bacterium]|nr:hypothetical protein [Oceanospirillaceae bacterium]